MCVHINSIDRNVLTAIQNGSFEITMTNIDGVVVSKLKAQWNTDDEKKWLCDWKSRNILISVLGVNQYYCVSNCTTVKATRDSLQVAHEGTNEAK